MTARLIAPELSLLRHKEKFFSQTEEERKVRNEHKKLLAIHLDQCIQAGYTHAIYTVPPMISGPFATYDVHEITLFLIKHCRSVGYKVEIHSPEHSTTLCLSGWESGDWLEKNRPPPVDISLVRKDPPKNSSYNAQQSLQSLQRTQTSRIPPKAKQTKVTPEEASVLAQQGALSRRLRAHLNSTGGNF